MNVEDKNIGLIGMGAIGHQVEILLLQSGVKEKNIFYFEDAVLNKKTKKKFKFWDFLKPEFKDWLFIPTIGYLSINIKMKVVKSILDSNLNLHTFIHPTAFINPTAMIGKGVIIYPMANVDQNVIIEDGVLINNSCIISHDSVIRKLTYLAPGVVTSGFVDIGAKCFVGSGSIFSNSVKIGNECTIGIGSCITKDIPDNSFAIGNPFKIKQNITLL
jgi:sugar O-acyltransferase (sialic acid O-acetyltransferase NeuD family)